MNITTIFNLDAFSLAQVISNLSLGDVRALAHANKALFSRIHQTAILYLKEIGFIDENNEAQVTSAWLKYPSKPLIGHQYLLTENNLNQLSKLALIEKIIAITLNAHFSKKPIYF